MINHSCRVLRAFSTLTNPVRISLLSLLQLAFAVDIFVLTLPASHPLENRTTDGKVQLLDITSPPLEDHSYDDDSYGFALDDYDDEIDQGDPMCTHSTNADYTSSSKYSNGYRALRAFEGERWSWASKKLYQSNFPQWIHITFGRPIKVVRFTFQGDSSYPANTPTVYELQGKDLETGSWTSVMSVRHPSYHEHNKREHEVSLKNQKLFKEYRLVVYSTIWLEKRWRNGYVQISFLKMCSDVNILP